MLKLSTYIDLIPGGLADRKIPENFDPNNLNQGIEVELEHTDDRVIAREVAMDHLTEDPNYYNKLAKMEKGSRMIVIMTKLAKKIKAII